MSKKRTENEIKEELKNIYADLVINNLLEGDFEKAFESFCKAMTVIGYEDILDAEHRIKEKKPSLFGERTPLKEMVSDNYSSSQCWRCGAYKRSAFAICSNCGED